MSDVRLKDITWGGRIRVDYQHEVWSIAGEAARKTTSSIYGNMVTSEETTTHYFLDGRRQRHPGLLRRVFGNADVGATGTSLHHLQARARCPGVAQGPEVAHD